MKKILLSTVCCFLTVLAFGQQATWNKGASATATSWNYIFVDDGQPHSITGTGLNNKSTAGDAPEARGFLPFPPSGTVILRSGSTSTSVFSIDGVTNALGFTSSTTTNFGKFAGYGITGTTAITSVNFTINFATAAASDWMFALGNSSTGGIFTSTSSFTASSTNASRNDAYAALKWTGTYTDAENPGKLQFGTYTTTIGSDDKSTSTVPNFVDIADYAPSTAYRIEMLINNNKVGNQYYTKKDKQYTVPAKSLHLWINDVQVELAGGADLPLSGDANVSTVSDKAINAFMWQGKALANDNGTTDAITISGLNLQSVTETVLPVSLTSFDGKWINNQVELKWQTASESNNSHFDVLRFSDQDQNPVKIAEVKGQGNANALVNYSYADKQALVGNNYYQLRQVDYDGKATLHPQTVAVKVGLNKASFNVSAGHNKTGEATFYSNGAVNATFTLSDINGRILNQFNSLLATGNNSVSLYSQTLSPGVYVATIVANGNQLAKKFVVQ